MQKHGIVFLFVKWLLSQPAYIKNRYKMKEAIYFVKFKSKSKVSQISKYVKDNPSLSDFYKWINEEHVNLQSDGSAFIIDDLKYIERTVD